MNGPEHYREAERWLAHVKDAYLDDSNDAGLREDYATDEEFVQALAEGAESHERAVREAAMAAAAAQAHAMLAHTAATAMSASVDGEIAGLNVEEYDAWRAAVEGKPTPALALTVYRASHDSIVMGLYETREAARAHCEADQRNGNPAATLEWRPDGEWREDDDGEPGPDEAEELYAYGTHETSTWDPTGFVVTPLTVAAAYDPEAES